MADPTRVLSLFAGGGGLDLATSLVFPAARTVCYVEGDLQAASVLASKMETGDLAPAPIWSDVTTFGSRRWRGAVDLIVGGFPCTDISLAGLGAGIDGEKSGLWREFVRIIRGVEPRLVFVENVAALTSRGLDRVLGDLSSLGFDAEWTTLSAGACGAPHRRDRIFILAYRRGDRLEGFGARGAATWAAIGGGRGEVADAEGDRRIEGRAEPAGLERGPDAPERGGAVANSSSLELRKEQGRREPGGARETEPRHAGPHLADSSSERIREQDDAPPSERRRRSWSRPDVGGGSSGVAHADERGREGERGGGLLDREREARGDDPDRCDLPIWPPGPGDPAWRDGSYSGPQPALRRDADGMAGRVDRLRILGNGVVPIQGAVALLSLLDRARAGQE